MTDTGGSLQASMYISVCLAIGRALGLFSCVNTKSDTLQSPIPLIAGGGPAATSITRHDRQSRLRLADARRPCSLKADTKS